MTFKETLKKIKQLKTTNTPMRNPLHPLSSIPDLSDEKEWERLRAVQEGVTKKIRGLMKGHYGFNPEN